MGRVVYFSLILNTFNIIFFWVGVMFLVTIIKKIFSSIFSVLIFIGIIYLVVKYQLYNPENIGEVIDSIGRFIDKVQDKLSGKDDTEFGLSEYGIVVETLPRGQSKYLVVLINNVDNNTELSKVVSAVKVLDTPVLIGINDLEANKLSSLVYELSNYKVSYGLVVPDEVLGDYDEVKQYVTDKLVVYGSYVTINTLIVSTISEAVSRYAVLNDMIIVKLGDRFGMSKLKVGNEVSNNYYFTALYYEEIEEENAPIIKEKIKKMIKDERGVMIVGFNADYLSSESAGDEESDETVSKSRLVQEVIINPIVEIYYGSSFKFCDKSFDEYIDFLKDVVRVSDYLSESNVMISKDEYGTKIEVPMGVYPTFITIKVPKEVGLIKVQKLASVNLYYIDGGKVESEKYHKQELEEEVLIYSLEDLKNVRLVITYVTSAE